DKKAAPHPQTIFKCGDLLTMSVVVPAEEKASGCTHLAGCLTPIASLQGTQSVESEEGGLLEADRQGLGDGVNVVRQDNLGNRQRPQTFFRDASLDSPAAQEQGNAIRPGMLPHTVIEALQTKGIGMNRTV